MNHGNYSTYTNRGCRCEECKEAYSAYQREYHKEYCRATKRQPKLDEMIQTDPPVLGDRTVELRNRRLHEDKTKKKCSYPGCKSNLNRWQIAKLVGLCMRHESEMARERMAAKLRKLERVS